jgi:superfamily II DNA/RNA helicase
MKSEDYTHRIGRTGRAGRDGLAVTFAEFRDRRKIGDIEAYSRQRLNAEVIPGLEPRQRPVAPAPERAGFGRKPGFGGKPGRSGGHRSGGGKPGYGKQDGWGRGERDRFAKR